MFQKLVPANLPPSPRNLLLSTLPPTATPPPPRGNRPCHLACHLPSLGYPEASGPRQISERLASELAEPGARCCYDLFLDFSLSLCCSTAVASRPIDGALALSLSSLLSLSPPPAPPSVGLSLSLTHSVSLHTEPEQPAVSHEHGGWTSFTHTPEEFLRNGSLTSD